MIKNIGDLMKQAQEMQGKMADMQSQLGTLEVTGKAGGGLVCVTLSGTGVLTALAIDDSLLKRDEKEILEDLLIAAHADAKSKVEGAIAEKMKEVTGGIPLPPGFNFGG